MKDQVSNNMDGKTDSHRFKTWKHKGRDAEVKITIITLVDLQSPLYNVCEPLSLSFVKYAYQELMQNFMMREA